MFWFSQDDSDKKENIVWTGFLANPTLDKDVDKFLQTPICKYKQYSLEDQLL